MDRANVTELDFSGESTAEEIEILPNNKLKNVVAADQGVTLIDHWKYLIFSEIKNIDSQATEDQDSFRSGEVLGSSNKILCALKKESQFTDLNKSDMSEADLSRNDHTSDAGKESLDNNSENKNLDLDDSGTNKTEQRRKSLIFSSKTKGIARATEEQGLDDSGLVLNNPIKIDPSIKMHSADTNKQSNTSKARLSHNRSISDENQAFLDDSSKNESTAADHQEANKINTSIKLSSKRKMSLRGMEDQELDDSGLVLDNSIEIGSATRADSEVANKKFNKSKTRSYRDRSTSDDDEVFVDQSLKNDAAAAEDQQVNKMRRRKLLGAKRKLSLQGTEDDELEESDEIFEKRIRGRYELRNLANRSFPDNLTKQVAEKHGPKKSRKGNTSQVRDEEETEDSNTEEETKVKREMKSEDFLQNKGTLPKEQVAHNNKILKMLNEGSPTHLKSLSRIGPKTAMMIHQYRKLRGKLESIRDLGEMPGWSPRFFEQFLSANNIILD